MVGVARIELATPAMSRQGLWRFFVYFCGFSCSGDANGAGTKRESREVLPHFCRAASAPRKLTNMAETSAPERDTGEVLGDYRDSAEYRAGIQEMIADDEALAAEAERNGQWRSARSFHWGANFLRQWLAERVPATLRMRKD